MFEPWFHQIQKILMYILNVFLFNMNLKLISEHSLKINLALYMPLPASGMMT